MIASITWAAPIGLDIGPLFIRFYQLLFLASFVIGHWLIQRIFRKENIPEKLLDSLLMTMVGATIVGARLGHVFFYDWQYYQHHIAEIFMPWKGGLASHGAAIAIVVALLWFTKKHLRPLNKSFFWLIDRVVITVALAACLIRVGNFTNSEIYGQPGNSSVETVFLRPVLTYFDNFFESSIADAQFASNGQSLVKDGLNLPGYTLSLTPSDRLLQLDEASLQSSMQHLIDAKLAPLLNNMREDNQNLIIPEGVQVMAVPGDEGISHYEVATFGIPRFPSQLFEAAGYLAVFLILLLCYRRGQAKREGLLFGLFLVGIFGLRIAIEFIKANQKAFETNMELNMGQWLSIPLVVIGVGLILRSFNQGKS